MRMLHCTRYVDFSSSRVFDEIAAMCMAEPELPVRVALRALISFLVEQTRNKAAAGWRRHDIARLGLGGFAGQKIAARDSDRDSECRSDLHLSSRTAPDDNHQRWHCRHSNPADTTNGLIAAQRRATSGQRCVARPSGVDYRLLWMCAEIE